MDYNQAADSFQFQLCDETILTVPRDLSLFFPSLAVNANEDIVIGMNGSSAAEHVGSNAVMGQRRVNSNRPCGSEIVFDQPLLL